MNISVIIPAAGRSSRFDQHQSGRSKLDEDLGGKSVLHRTIELFHTRPEVGQIIVVGPQDPERMNEFKLRHSDRLVLLGCSICQGGAQRTDSVRNALELVGADATHIAVHDAARPAASSIMIDRVFAAAQHHDAVVPVVPINDTLKRISASPIDDAPSDPLDAILGAQDQLPMHEIESGVDRDRLVSVQTPQVFERTLIERAYAQTDESSTDDAGLVELLGERVVSVAGEARNIKLTRAEDLPVLMAIMGIRATDSRDAHKRF